jgi:GNAT superfamily N-acetyltransferase
VAGHGDREDGGERWSGLTLTHRRLSRGEATALHEDLKSTPNILGYTASELLRFQDVLVASAADGAFAGACINKDLAFGWTDIAVVYVLPAFRGRGAGTLLYTAAWESARSRGRHIVTLSRSPAVIHLMERLGMRITHSPWKAPLAFHLEMNRHMMSLYRVRESFRKSALRAAEAGESPGWALGTLRCTTD